MLTIRKVFIRMKILLDGYFEGKYSFRSTHERLWSFIETIPELHKEQLDVHEILNKIGTSQSLLYDDLMDKVSYIEIALALWLSKVESGDVAVLDMTEIDRNLRYMQLTCEEMLTKLESCPSDYNSDDL
ncbi:hypothetical protein PVA45_05920 [Entomospira entomophila]|uniref:Uncharacterized protein n=1 Tax=Entomospira entomophila TaxID=2719988 RepID=A0A968GDI9_9SPIO|nr:hypothetical protein [Entomospira entomophilus]NIZ41034.1 hypothetical protein [Entomospira entomophilus]WDI35247.1 hypothetical protein PVA45_05920 [Entomospira entomophilus]